MRNLIDFTTGVCVIAFLYVIFRYIQTEYLSHTQFNDFIAAFYIPASVRVFSSLLFGYWAAAGIALGLFLDISYLHPENFILSEIIVRMFQSAISLCLSLLIWAKLSSKVTCLYNPIIDFRKIDAFDILQICIIEAVINSVTAHIFYIWSPSVRLQFDLNYFAVMLFGDLTGSFLIFIIANIMFSLIKRTPFFPRKHYDDTMNNQ